LLASLFFFGGMKLAFSHFAYTTGNRFP